MVCLYLTAFLFQKIRLIMQSFFLLERADGTAFLFLSKSDKSMIQDLIKIVALATLPR